MQDPYPQISQIVILSEAKDLLFFLFLLCGIGVICGSDRLLTRAARITAPLR